MSESPSQFRRRTLHDNDSSSSSISSDTASVFSARVATCPSAIGESVASAALCGPSVVPKQFRELKARGVSLDRRLKNAGVFGRVVRGT